MEHVVFLNAAGHGHINPTAPLVAALTSRGIKVTYFTNSRETYPQDTAEAGTPLGELIQGAGATLCHYRADASLADHEDLKSTGHPMHPGKYFTWLSPLLEDLKALQPPPNVIIFDCFGVLPQVAANILKIPAVGLIPNTGPACTAPYEMEDGPKLFEGCCKYVKTTYDVDILETGIPMMSWYSTLLNIVLTAEEFYMGFGSEAQKEKYGSVPFRCVGSLIDPETSVRPPVEGFPKMKFKDMAKGKQVILVSLGTAITGMFFERPLPRSENELAEKTGKDLAHHVWKAAFEALGNREDAIIVMALGDRGEAVLEGLGDVPKNFMPVPVVPQLEVLKECSAFVTHGGMGSVMESIVYKVPMVVVPGFGDQPDNAESVQKSKLGFSFRYPLRTLSADSLGKAVDALLDPAPENEYKAAVMAAAKKMEDNGGVDKTIEIIQSVVQ